MLKHSTTKFSSFTCQSASLQSAFVAHRFKIHCHACKWPTGCLLPVVILNLVILTKSWFSHGLINSLFYSTLSLFTQVCKWVPETYCWGVTLWWISIPSRGRVAILLAMLHTKETGISSSRLCLWLVCTFTLPYLTFFFSLYMVVGKVDLPIMEL